MLSSTLRGPTIFFYIMKTFTADIIEADDGTGDSILQFPEEFITEQDWREGDTIHMDLINGQLIMRNLDWMKRENISE